MGEVASVERVPASLLPRRPLFSSRSTFSRPGPDEGSQVEMRINHGGQ
jgi:hypothetical protein